MKAILFWVMAGLLCVPLAGADEIADDTDAFAEKRKQMVQRQISDRGVSAPRVLAAMTAVPRHWFVPPDLLARAYADHPLPIGEGQTISQPYIVALMTESLELSGVERVLEVGTGSGYQAAVLAKVVDQVYSIEIKAPLHRKAAAILDAKGFSNIKTRHGDGYFGWQAAAPFDAVMITAAVDHIPPPLLRQLKDGGRLILPLGNPFMYQNLVLVTKTGEDYTVKTITGVLFVPLTGHALEKDGQGQ
jgi:protein-L-isoaspartate(D-aspartate) O-methyltransferase